MSLINSLLTFDHCFLIIDRKEEGERTKSSLTVFFTERLNHTIFWDKIIIVFTHACHKVFAASTETLFSQTVFMKRAKRLNISVVKINKDAKVCGHSPLCSLMPVGWQPLGAAMGLEVSCQTALGLVVSNSSALFTLFRFHQQTWAPGQP